MNNWRGGRNNPENEYRRPSERYDREEYYRNSNPDHLPDRGEQNTWHFAGKFEDKNDPTYSYGTRERDMMREYPTYPTNDREYFQRHPKYGTRTGYGDNNYYGNEGDYSSLGKGHHYDQGYSRSQYGYRDSDRYNVTQKSGDMARNMAGQNSDWGWRDGNEAGGRRLGGSQNSAPFSELSDFRESKYPGTNYAGRGPKGWKRSDESIREQVCAALEAEPRIDATEIEVEVKEGIVTLKGNIHDRPAKRLAEDVIEFLPGVNDVHNQLTVDKTFFERAKEFLTGEHDTGAGETPSKPGRTEKNPRH